MNKFKRQFSIFAALLGLLGVVACTVALVLVWMLGARLTQANEEVFNGIDKSIVAVRGRVLDAQRRVQASRITTAEIKDRVKNLAAKEASERLALRPEVEAATERLSLALEQAGLWLGSSEDALRGVQQALAMARSLGAPVDAKFLDELLVQLTMLRQELSQTTDVVDGIRLRLTEEENLRERMDEAARLVLRMLAMLSELGSRLGLFAERIADAQADVQDLKSKTHAYLIAAAAGGVLFSVWMMAGQFSLCRRGYESSHQRQSAD